VSHKKVAFERLTLIISEKGVLMVMIKSRQ